MASSPPEEQPPTVLPQQPPRREDPPMECLHKTKSIQFFSRPTPVILQNDNGPCPLLAICNVLLLRNQLNLSADISEVSQEKLLSLVAERLIDSNSNVNNKDAEYVQNQQQNIADAIDLLPRLTTGIDVNIKFRRVGDFEFTRECAIFDLLDIPLYHGWLVDPQDYETAGAIGSKSYNTITRELVSLKEAEGKARDDSEEDCVDFAAATAATLGVPSPCLSRGKSFDESPRAASDEPKGKKGDIEEEAELMRAIELSENETLVEGANAVAAGPCGEHLTLHTDESQHQLQNTPTSFADELQEHDPSGKVQAEPCISSGIDFPCNVDGLISLERPLDQVDKPEVASPSDQISFNQSAGSFIESLTMDAALDQNESKLSSSIPGIGSASVPDQGIQTQSNTTRLLKETATVGGTEFPAPTHVDGDLHVDCTRDAGLDEGKSKESSIDNSTAMGADFPLPSSNVQKNEATDSFGSSLNDNEPIYEGEECIVESAATVCDDREPVYEGEAVLAGQGDGPTGDVCDSHKKDEITPREGELICNFLKNNASQLTFYGLFSLQEGLKERELCVFFRNNHFSTMFKFEGELYLLTTDQGYLNEPGIVWEKLNEVNGDSVFYDSNFKEFNPENQANGSWDERNAVATTADYLASIGNTGQGGSNINSDLQLAIALQQQEFEHQQPQRRAQQGPPHPTAPAGSRLVTGPQHSSRSNPKAASSSSPRQEKKSKEGCSIM